MALADDPVYAAGAPLASYWSAGAGPAPVQYPPLDADVRCDVAVVGAGYTGLNAALALASVHHLEVVVLEAAQPGWGASGRNGGFCCLGSSKLSLRQLVRRFGLAETRRFHDAQRQAIDHVAAILDEHGIDADRSGRGEVALAHRRARLGALEDERRELERLLGWSAELLDRAALAQRGLAGPAFHGGLLVPVGFALQPLKYVRGLAAAAAAAGVDIRGDSPVSAWTRDGAVHRLRTPHGSVRADRLVLAANAYSPESVFAPLRGTLLPAISAVLVTRPLDAGEREAQGWWAPTMAFDTRDLLHYFRLLPDGRFLFGGRGGIVASQATFDGRRRSLRRTFERCFPAWRGVETEYFWRGFVCLAADRVPHVSALDERGSVWTSLAYHGGGVAMASWCGRTVADLVAGRARIDDLPAVIRQPLPTFPLAGLRRWYLRAAYLGYHVTDEWL
jgi:glycine/D-amino acid oxidase-like deaminating enzyme